MAEVGNAEIKTSLVFIQNTKEDSWKSTFGSNCWVLIFSTNNSIYFALNPFDGNDYIKVYSQ